MPQSTRTGAPQGVYRVGAHNGGATGNGYDHIVEES